ncbi:pilus assembly FimT family protein [Campylobacter hyointestinalis]|uniref:Type II/IV secretion system protein n=1 Tax=Campylobacter hyointestinalis subsp. hyointestinalis TaxID=91352 RepID=A0A855NCE6_CAMHY|nr:prepilin-type N-terminal cleavage/methylation domain-containing protein [Campylobacter hyointestinalis]PPB56958.1 type II/IV secretion system protein [Campylobacter hyointestinalis subsp. hyointestinalis]PPB62082.1 type II/IV secretion system protein [Campylobacter hyointestinalis subsp. hyointestinalis]PPB71060.1 type II/IV secretion system protein [Campylobacter hyointestinalis subsp. hyointestinalis]RAZ26098.1 prepilin-type N-terminal cleavage/methylation domain-containing protein [Campyl
MKKAFTFFEIVVVIVVIGIMAAFVAPKFGRDDLRLAADQIAAHIRYTQHLAMIDDKYDPGNANWYKAKWRIFFSDNNFTNNKLTYMVFQDKSGESKGNPNSISEIAKNPNNNAKLMTAGYSGGLAYTDKRVSKELNIEDTYNIDTIKFKNGCSVKGGTTTLSFDELGRPYKGNPTSQESPYQNIMTEQCTIILTHKNGSKCTINVEPETGYVTIKEDCGSN